MKLRRCAFLVAALALASCDAPTLASGPVVGRVIDPDTQQPVAGAVVVAKWGRAEGILADNVNVCRHVATAVTDADGRYHFDQWPRDAGSGYSLFASPFTLSLDAYKPGMTIIRRGVIKQDEMTGALELAQWSGTHPARMQSLQAILTSTELDCDGDAGGRDVLEALRETIDAEVRSIATTDDDDQKIVQHLDTVRRNIEALDSLPVGDASHGARPVSPPPRSPAN